MIDIDRDRDIWLETDPKGWDKSEKTLKRSTKGHGIFTELSKNLQFYEDGAEFLRLAWLNRDIQAVVILEEHRSIPDADGFYVHSIGTFDFSAYKSSEYFVQIPFKTGGLSATIKAQIKKKFKLGRTTSINNATINALVTKEVALDGRELFLKSTWDTDNLNQIVGSSQGLTNYKLEVQTNDGSTRVDLGAVPLRIVGQSHEEAVYALGVGGLEDTGSVSQMFFFNSEVNRTLNLEGQMDLSIWFQQYENVQWCKYYLALTVYENGTNLDVKTRYELDRLDSDLAISNPKSLPSSVNYPYPQFTKELSATINQTIELLAGESLAIETRLKSDMYVDNNAGVRAYAQNINCNLLVSEDSLYPPSITKTALFHDVGDKLTQIITGEQNRFESEFYGREELGYGQDGEFAYTGLFSGFWIRNFLDKDFEFSLEDFLNTSNVLHNTGYSVIKPDNKEILIVEDKKFFFRQETLITLDMQVTNIERSAAKDLYNSGMEIGYDKPSGDNLYEEANGLDEYNTTTEWAKPITRVDTDYKKVAKTRADTNGIEFARRKSRLSFPDLDTRYDKTPFVIDLKTTAGSRLTQRLWADDFSAIPTGIFSPETAYNLRLSPYRVSKRHEWFYGSGLAKFRDDYVTHASAIITSNLGTTVAGETERKETDDILISNLEPSRFKNEYIEFELEVDYYVNRQVFGFTEIDGRKIPNYFGKIQFINEFGKKEYGYLMELKPNGEGKWKLLKAI